ncbi:MGDG synthase family glycosyltransferase [Cohnella thailandensis]|uniref:Glycosyltransferase n=1 Tax=Cohnella thailandensis TaxID=557557 RepID=A0A841T380_9BACL|nr:glycosyltransferase [Cohnella thailandensis]MBB6637459.1 glycosyltransferase [Cohnella thailandensis]MBP1977490.1 processive 1,2-diacylglycerol beta-glucosyltransferase [Cohnella thailandensis]
MKPESRIAIVYSKFGDGHLKVAQALKQSFESHGYRNVRLYDLLEETHPRLNAVSRRFYLKSASYAPRVYGFIYRATNVKPSRLVSRLFHSVGMKRLREEWARERPDLVIHTFPLLAADELRYKLRHDIPTITVITDYVLHTRWVHRNTSMYFVGCESLKRSLSAAGVPASKIAVTGIPLREAFRQTRSREELCRQYKLEADRSRILMMAGAYGVQTSVKAIMDTVLANADSDVIVVCGKNAKLKRSLEAEYASSSRVTLIGYADHIHELMAMSDCLLTKAGGITLTEAMAMSLPTVVYRPLPGQERGNAEYLSAMGAVRVAYRIEELALQLRIALSKDGAGRMKEAMRSLYRQESVSTIASRLYR